MPCEGADTFHTGAYSFGVLAHSLYTPVIHIAAVRRPNLRVRSKVGSRVGDQVAQWQPLGSRIRASTKVAPGWSAAHQDKRSHLGMPVGTLCVPMRSVVSQLKSVSCLKLWLRNGLG